MLRVNSDEAAELLVDAIRTGDPELAGAAMRVHIAMVARAIELDSAEAETQARSKSVK